MTKKNRNIVICCVCILGVSGGVYLACASKESSPSATVSETTQAPDMSVKVVTTASVMTNTVNESTTYPGMVFAFQTASLTFRVGGPLVEINVDPGDRVKRGDVLMQIDPRDFKNELASIESQLAASEARFQALERGARPEDILLLEAMVEAAQSRADFTAEEFKRVKILRESRTATQTEFEEAQYNDISARMALETAKQELAKGKAGARAEDIVAARADLQNLKVKLQIAKDNLNDTTLRAPFDGMVTNKMIENFEMVTTTPTYKEVICVHDISKLKVHVYLPEKELIKRTLSKDFEVSIVFTASPGEVYHGKLYELDTQPHSANGLYIATFVLDAPKELHVLPGMFAEVMVASDAKQIVQQLIVPATAVLGDGDGESFVWCIDDATSTATKKMIKRGPLTQRNHYVILDGLKEGETIITGGNRFLAEGIKVTLAAQTQE